jgi:hypothetical protein
LLEDRVVPLSFKLMTFADGIGSLRDAIIDANGACGDCRWRVLHPSQAQCYRRRATVAVTEGREAKR